MQDSRLFVPSFLRLCPNLYTEFSCICLLSVHWPLQLQVSCRTCLAQVSDTSLQAVVTSNNSIARSHVFWLTRCFPDGCSIHLYVFGIPMEGRVGAARRDGQHRIGRRWRPSDGYYSVIVVRRGAEQVGVHGQEVWRRWRDDLYGGKIVLESVRKKYKSTNNSANYDTRLANIMHFMKKGNPP